MLRTVFLLCLLLLAASAPKARAQTRRHIWAQATVGPYWFIDEDPIDHLIVGGNAHVTWTPRLGFEADGFDRELGDVDAPDASAHGAPFLAAVKRREKTR